MRLFFGILIVLAIWYERELIKTALAPLIDISVCVAFLVLLILLIVCEVALMVIAPVALFLGHESRDWHTRIARKIMLHELGRKNGS